MSNEAAKSSAVDGWSVLRTGGHRSGGLEIPTVPTGVRGDSGQVRLAVGPANEPRILIPLAEHETPSGIHGGSALAVDVSAFHYKGHPARFLDLICLSSDLEGVFGDVVDEMLDRIRTGQSCLDAARSTIQDFRSLLTRGSASHVDQRAVAGLIAELLVVNRLLDRSASAWRAWAGPAGDRHDFRLGNTSLEVKATLRPGNTIVTINSLDQLEAPTGGTLHLLRFVIEPVSSGQLNVSGLGRSAMAKSDDPEALETLLAAVGCEDVDAERWNRHAFRIESEHFYEVRDGFPRITLSMLSDGSVPHGVDSVTYQIDLAAAQGFLSTPARYDDLEARLAS